MNDLLVGLPVKSIGIDPNDIFVFLTSVCSCLIVGLGRFSTTGTVVSNTFAHWIFGVLRKMLLIEPELALRSPSSGLKSMQQCGYPRVAHDGSPP